MSDVLCPFVANYLKTVLRHKKIGICAGNISVSDIDIGSLVIDDEKPVGDRFKIHLPYAGQHVIWELIFNSCYPDYPPEIILGTDDEDFDPEIENLKSYCSWSSNDEEVLLVTLQELMNVYRNHHLSLLKGSRLEYDYNSLLDESSCSGCHPQDIEVYVSRKNGFSSGPVRFLIRLNVDFSPVPEYLLKDVSDDDMALLLITYQNLDGGSVSPQILFSPRLERLFNPNGGGTGAGGTGGFRIPAFPHEGCLMDYVPSIRKHLETAVQSIRTSYDKRKEYIAAFLAHFTSQVMEFDSVQFHRIVCLFEWQNFRFLINVEIGPKFPQDQPTIIFQSIYHTKPDGAPYAKAHHHYPYSPRWDSDEMAERARAFIISTIPDFQKDSLKDGV